MKILYVYDTLALYGGIERILTDKMNCLVSMYGYDVFLLTTNQGDHPLPFPLHHDVKHEDLHVQTHLQYRYHGLRRYWERWRRNRLLMQRLKERILAIQPDVIVSTTSRYIPQLCRLKGHIPLVAESHSGFGHVLEYERMTWRRRWETRRLLRWLRNADVLVSLTESDARQWRTVHPHVVLIPNMVHVEVTVRPFSPTHSKRAIFVGRLAHQKSVPEVIAAWQLVHQRHPDWWLDIYGEGELQELVETLIASAGANIELHSPVSNIFSCYRNSAILLLTSLYEPFGLVLPEAMSCGLPVVAFDCPYGPADIITDGIDGFLIKDRSVEDFASTVCQLIEDQELRRRTGEAGIQSSRRYSAGDIMPKWKHLFETLTGGK